MLSIHQLVASLASVALSISFVPTAYARTSLIPNPLPKVSAQLLDEPPSRMPLVTEATPIPTPVITWHSNPQHCTDNQWIAAEAPFSCIDKYSQAPNATQQTNTPQTVKVGSTKSVNVTAYTLLSGVDAAIHVPYVYGGTTLAGFDCSGLTQWLSSLRGHTIPRTTAGQIAALTHISRDEALAGDIVAFNYGHVGMYLGGNKVIHALNPSQGIQIADLDSAIRYNGFLSMLAVR